ncbi:MAG: hypothetical protein AB7O04_08695 [Hyphomonadaceae bacterium]
MSDSIPPLSREAIARQAVARAADATGANFDALLATARRESSLNAHARAGTSSAAGLFQFIEGTWLEMVRRHGAQHGLAREAQALNSGRVDASTRRDILNLRFDPELSARMAGELWRENARTLEARLGRAPNEGELYAAHVMGPQGAARLINAAQRGEANAAALFPREAAANQHLFFDRAGNARSASGLLERLSLNLTGNPTGTSSAPTSEAQSGATLTESAKLGASAALSPALLDALFALALGPSLQSEERDPALDLLRRDDI